MEARSILEMIGNVEQLGRSKYKVEVWYNGNCSSTIYKLREKDFYNIVDTHKDGEHLFKAWIGDCLYCKHIKA